MDRRRALTQRPASTEGKFFYVQTLHPLSHTRADVSLRSLNLLNVTTRSSTRVAFFQIWQLSTMLKRTPMLGARSVKAERLQRDNRVVPVAVRNWSQADRD